MLLILMARRTDIRSVTDITLITTGGLTDPIYKKEPHAELSKYEHSVTFSTGLEISSSVT